MKKVLLAILLILVLTVGFIIFNTLNFKPTSYEYAAIQKVEVDANAKQRLADAIAIHTIFFENEEDFDSSQFQLPTLFNKAYNILT